MRHTLSTFLVTALTLQAPVAFAQEDERPDAVADESAASDLARLDKAYRGARTAYYKAASVHSAARKENADAELPKLVHPDPEYVLAFRDAAKRHAGSPEAASFLIRAFDLCYRTETDASKEILGELLDGHMHSERLPELAFKLIVGAHPNYLGRDRVDATIDRIIEESPHAAVQAAFLYSRASLVNRSRAATAEERAFAVADLERAIELGTGTSYVDMSQRMKFELVNLQVGLPAPEIEGQDLDGVTFKLSDYHGRVVVLDFWGDW